MADAEAAAAGLPWPLPPPLLSSWLPALLPSVFFPMSSSLAVRIIAGMFAALGTAFVLPIVGLVVYDVCLWVWRLNTQGRHALQRQQQQQQEALQQSQKQKQTTPKAQRAQPQKTKPPDPTADASASEAPKLPKHRPQ